MKEKLDMIMEGYKHGTLTIDEANEQLEAIGSIIRLNPNKNAISPEEYAIGDAKNGWAMLDIGIGKPDKVQIVNGKLKYGVGKMQAFVEFKGEKYTVADDGVTLVPVK